MSVQRSSIFAGNLSMLLQKPYALKSTEKKQERRMECERQVEFWTKQKENLKEVESNSIDEIQHKLDLFYTYEDEIKAAKAKYNEEQKQHILEEAEEKGKKIAEAAEKQKPKTEEEIKAEARKEAREDISGAEEGDSFLEEIMEKVQEEVQESEDMFLDEMLKEEEKLEEQKKEIVDKEIEDNYNK